MPVKINITPQQASYIKANCYKKARKKIAKAIGLSDGVVKRFYKENGIVVSKELSLKFQSQAMCGKTTFTQKEDAFIKANYLTMPVKTLASKLNRSGCGVLGRLKALGLKIPKEIVEKRKAESRYKKGHVPANKGKKLEEFMKPETITKFKANQFKKGQTPHNAKYNFAISKRHDKSDRPYYYIRIAEGNWQLLHRFIWQKHHGKIPKGHCVQFKDGNSLNCAIENLYLIHRKKQAVINLYGGKKIPHAHHETILIISEINKKIRQYEKHNG